MSHNTFQLLRFLNLRFLNMLLKIVLHVEQNSNLLDKKVVEQINKIIKCEKATNVSLLSKSFSFLDLTKCVHV